MMNQPLTFVIWGKESEALNAVSGALSAQPGMRLLGGGSQAEQLHAEVVRLRPTAVIILFGADPEQELRLIKQLAHDCPETLLIGTAGDASPDLILNSMRAGAREFLRLPLIAEEFDAVLDRAAEFAARQVAAPPREGRVMAVFSNKGGCGTSFLAANLAIALNAPAALVDLNLQAGDLGFLFHLEPKFSITNLIENLTKMDDALLASLLTPHPAGVSLLSAPRGVDAAIGVQASQVREVIELLRKRFEYVVIDLAHLFDEITLAALDQADDILLVLTPEVMTIRSAQRALSVFDRLDYPREKVHLVVNRWDRKSLNLDWRQIERFLGQGAAGFIPDDSRAVVNSINLGQPLLAEHPSAPISAEIRRLACRLTGNAGGAERASATGHKPAGVSAKGGGHWTARMRSVFARA